MHQFIVCKPTPESRPGHSEYEDKSLLDASILPVGHIITVRIWLPRWLLIYRRSYGNLRFSSKGCFAGSLDCN